MMAPMGGGTARALACIAGALCFPRLAHAAGVTVECGLAQPEVMSVDGLLDDWGQGAGVSATGSSAEDATLSVRCAYDSEALYVLLEVRDDRVVRTRKGGAG